MKYFWDENHNYILTISIFQPSALKPTHTIFTPNFQLTLINHLKNTHSIDNKQMKYYKVQYLK